MENKKLISRRGFIASSAVTAAGITILPSQVVGGLGHTAPSDKLNIAGIGVGSKGGVNLMGNLAVRMQGLQKKLKWDGENMIFTNLADDDKITVTNGISGAEPKKIELNAKQFSAELIRTNYREGWSLKI